MNIQCNPVLLFSFYQCEVSMMSLNSPWAKICFLLQNKANELDISPVLKSVQYAELRFYK